MSIGMGINAPNEFPRQQIYKNDFNALGQFAPWLHHFNINLMDYYYYSYIISSEKNNNNLSKAKSLSRSTELKCFFFLV